MRDNVLRIVFFFTVLIPCATYGQFTSFDIPSVEAFIQDHKTQRSLLIARSTLEESNKVLHGYTATAGVEYKDINVELDKYTRMFDIIDILYQSLRISLNTYSTYETISEKISGYKDMLKMYKKKCLDRGDIVSTDTLIISINRIALRNITKETENLYRSVNDIIVYATGAASCSTSDLLTVLGSINGSLDNIRTQVNSAYFATWRYIQVRIGYWKAEVYRAKNLEAILGGAFYRWRDAGRLNK